MDFPWKPVVDPASDSDLVGVVGELRPARYRTVPRVLRMTRRIESQLAESDGLVGYALRAEFFRRRFRAVAVWESEESLRDFVAAKPHVDVMAALRPLSETSRFETFAVKGEDVPIDFDEAIARVD